MKPVARGGSRHAVEGGAAGEAGPSLWPDWRTFLRSALPLILLFAVSLPAVTTRLYASDEIEYFAYLRSVWFDRDLSFDNEYHYFYDRGIAHGARPRANGQGVYGGLFEEAFLETTTPTGLRINFAPVGTAILWAPFYAVADLGVRVARAAGMAVAADGFSRPYIAAVTYGSAVYGFLAVLLSTLATRRIFGDVDVTGIAVWLGTPLVFYMYVAPGYSHGCSAFAVAAFVVVWLRVRENWTAGGVVALGALAALMGMVREQDGFVAVGPAIDFAVAALRSVRTGQGSVGRWVGRACAGLLATAVCILPQAYAYLTLYGRLGPSATVAGKMNWTAPYTWKVLVSTEYGALFWTPLLIPAVAGLCAVALGRLDGPDAARSAGSSDRRWIVGVLLIMVASEIWVSGSVSSWTGSGFGQRRLLGLTICLIVGLSALRRMVSKGWPRRTLAAGVAACVWWNLGLIAQYGTGLSDRQRLDLRLNAYHNVVTIPALIPTLAYRYLFDRASFYRGPAGRSTSER